LLLARSLLVLLGVVPCGLLPLVLLLLPVVLLCDALGLLGLLVVVIVVGCRLFREVWLVCWIGSSCLFSGAFLPPA